MAYIAELFGDKIVNKNKEKVDAEKHFAGKTVGIYFSAHWCPPCRGFTPVLVEFYKKYHEEKKFEIIFVSSDRSDEDFEEYYGDMPWLALNFNEKQAKSAIAKKFQVNGIPRLIFLNADNGKVNTDDGRSKIQYDDKEGKEFPWND